MSINQVNYLTAPESTVVAYCREKIKQTRQIAGKYPPLVPITPLGLKEKKISTKIDFCIKTFLSAIYYDVNS